MKNFYYKVLDKIRTYMWTIAFSFGYGFNPRLGFPYRHGLWTHIGLFFDDVEQMVVYRYGSTEGPDIDMDKTDFFVYKYKELLPEGYDIYTKTTFLLASLALKQYTSGLGFNSLMTGTKLRIYTNSPYVAGELRNHLSRFKDPYGYNPYFFQAMGMKAMDQHGIPYNFSHNNGNLFITYKKEG